MPGLDDAARFIGTEARRAINDAKGSVRGVLNDTKSAASRSAFDVPGAMVASSLKNGMGLGLKLLIARPAEWIFKCSSKLAMAGVKTGLQLASLIPIPLPGGPKNVAQMRASVADVRQAIDLGARGDPRPLGVIMGELQASRQGTQNRPATTPPAAPTDATTPPQPPPAA